MNKKYFACLALSTAILAGCGSENSGNDYNEPVAPEKLKSLVSQTNLAKNFPGLYSDHLYGTAFDQKGLIRFDTSSQIPLYFVSADGSQPPAEIKNAVANIESRLGDIFTDFTPVTEDLSGFRDLTYPNENRGNNTYNHETFSSSHGISTGGLIFSIGTAFYSSERANSPQEMCGNASIGPYTGSMSLVINENTSTYTGDNLLWVNLSNGNCNWGTEMAMHEMSHAMGMYKHLDGYFGSWSNTAMDILATIYSNPAGTAYENLLPNIQ